MSAETAARPEVILQLATEFAHTVLSLNGREATVLEGILALSLASEHVLKILQAAGGLSDAQISAVRESMAKVVRGERVEPSVPLLKDQYGFGV